MPVSYNIHDLRTILKSVSLRIEMLETVKASSKPDREFRRRLKEAKIEETVVLEKLAEFEKNRRTSAGRCSGTATWPTETSRDVPRLALAAAYR